MAQAAAQTISSQEHVPAGEHGRGFPPFDSHNFASQILWLALTFIAPLDQETGNASDLDFELRAAARCPIVLCLKPGAVFISLARREFEPEGWVKVDKVVIDSWEMNYLMPFFKQMVDSGVFSRDQLHGEIHEVVAGTKPVDERRDRFARPLFT